MAAEILNLFTRVDLWAMLLPGYVVLILGLAFFYPSSLVISNDANLNLFSAIVFIVAGPAIGFTLTQFSVVITQMTWDQSRYDFLREYYQTRLEYPADKKTEFDNIDSRITFSRSTGMGLMIIAFLFILIYNHSNDFPDLLLEQFSSSSSIMSSFHTLSSYPLSLILSMVICGLGIFLIIGVSLESVNIRDILICRELVKKKPINEYENSVSYTIQKLTDPLKRRSHRTSSLIAFLIVATAAQISLVWLYFGYYDLLFYTVILAVLIFILHNRKIRDK